MTIGSKTNEDARQYFVDCGLTYDKLCGNEMILLKWFLAEELKGCDYEGLKMKLSNKEIIKENDGKLVEAYFEVDGPYFKKREAISFNKDGFIGFAGWASSNNSIPFLEAFTKWCDKITQQEE